jgi:hypothetical protein
MPFTKLDASGLDDLSQYLRHQTEFEGLKPMERFLQSSTGFVERCGALVDISAEWSKTETKPKRRWELGDLSMHFPRLTLECSIEFSEENKDESVE